MRFDVIAAFLATLLVSGCVTLSRTSDQMELHRNRAQNIQSDGWNLMQSTMGKFSAKVPGDLAFADMTYREETFTSYTLMTQSSGSGMRFEATLVQGGGSETAIQFDEKYRDANSSLRQFKGYPGIWDQRYGNGGVFESMWFKTPKGIFVLRASAPMERSSETDKFFASFDFDLKALPEPNVVPAHVLVKLAAKSMPLGSRANTTFSTVTFSGAVTPERKPMAVRELTQYIASAAKDGSYRGVIIEDQRIASEIFLEVLNALNLDSSKDLKLVFVGTELEREAALGLAKSKGVDLVYVARRNI